MDDGNGKTIQERGFDVSAEDVDLAHLPSLSDGGSTTITLEDLVHVGPGTLMGRYLRTFWHPVLRVQDLAPGEAKPMRVLGEDFTLYRGEGGDFHAVGFRCAHRGTQLSSGWIEGDCIRCFYHGWKYDASGQCVEQPDEDPRFAAKIRIRSYPTQSYIGFVFVYFGEGEPSDLPRFRNFEDDGTDSVFAWHSYTWPCSYLNGQENDSFHGNWVHREQYEAIGRRAAPGELKVEVKETEYGFVSQLRREGAQRFRETNTHNLIPNMRMRRSSGGGDGHEGGWQEAIRWSVPVDDDHFTDLSVSRTYVSGEARQRYEERQRRMEEQVGGLPSAIEIGEAVLRGETRPQSFPGKLGVSDPRNFNVCDYVSQVGQGPFGLLNDSHLGRADLEVIMLRRIYRRELKALAEGRPLKNWVIPDRLLVRVSED